MIENFPRDLFIENFVEHKLRKFRRYLKKLGINGLKQTEKE
jgi:hypothetical protein